MASTLRVTVAGAEVPTAIHADINFQTWGLVPGGPSAPTATVQLGGPAAAYVDPEAGQQSIKIEAMVGGSYETLFTGLTVGPNQGYFPSTTEIQARGFLSLAERPLPTTLTFRNQNDGPIIGTLLAAAGVPDAWIFEDSGYTMFSATGHKLVVRAGTAPLGVIGELDALTLRPTYEDRFGQVRRDHDALSPPSSSWTYRQGSGGDGPVLGIKRPRPFGGSRAKLKVLGYISSDPSVDRVYAASIDDTSPLWNYVGPLGKPAEPVVSDYLELTLDCADVCGRHMKWRNRVEDLITLTVGPNPYIGLLDVITLETASGVDVTDSTDYQVIGYHHSVGDTWQTEITGLKKDLGSEGVPYSLLPRPSMTVSTTTVTSANQIATTSPTPVYADETRVTCDGRGTMDSLDSGDTGYANLDLVWGLSAPGFNGAVDPANPAEFRFTVPATFTGSIVVKLKATNGDRVSATAYGYLS